MSDLRPAQATCYFEYGELVIGESCSHFGALLFKMEVAVRLGYTKKACTSEACKWNNDFVKKVKGEPIRQGC